MTILMIDQRKLAFYVFGEYCLDSHNTVNVYADLFFLCWMDLYFILFPRAVNCIRFCFNF